MGDHEITSVCATEEPFLNNDEKGWHNHDDDEPFLLNKQNVFIYIFLILQTALAITETIMAGLWRHWIGLAFGCLMLAVGSLFCFVMGRFPAILTTGRKIIRYLLWILNSTFLLFIVLLIVIHVTGPDTKVNAFPGYCPRATNCVLLTSVNATNAKDFSVPHFNTTTSKTTSIIQNYWDSRPGASLINKIAYNSSIYLQYRTVTFFWGFPDDNYFLIFCNNGTSEVWIQAQSRLGIDDLGQNHKRTQEFLVSINQTHYEPTTCV